MTQLVELDLQRTRVTDAGMEHLKHLPELRGLHLEGTAVTAAGADNLRSVLPHLIIPRRPAIE